MRFTLMILILAFFCCSCVSLRPESKAKLREVKELGLDDKLVERSNPLTAGILNLLPGGGNIYLACTSDEELTNWILFPVNFFTWPLSIVWGVPQVAIDANTVNKQATADYYMFDENGKALLKKANEKANQ